MVSQKELEQYLSSYLKVSDFQDYAPNGLQVSGCSEIKTIVSATTASLEAIEAAIEFKADALLVHHGYFWKGEDPCVVGMKRKRLQKLLCNNINLFAYHLPLDAHPELGNNAELARLLDIHIEDVMDKQGVGNTGTLNQPMLLDEFAIKIEEVLGRKPLCLSGGDHLIRNIAWCSGGAQKYLQKAAELGVDAYLSGEVSENTLHEARELGVHYIAAGHHATERYGVQSLGEHLAQQFSISHIYTEIDNPA